MIAIPSHDRFAMAGVVWMDKIFGGVTRTYDGINRDSVSSLNKDKDRVRLSYGLFIAVVIAIIWQF